MGAGDSLSSVTEPSTDGLAIVTTFVWSGMEPLRGVIHDVEGTWQFLCNTTHDPKFLLTVHADHVFERFPADLADLRELPRGHAAWRDYPSEPWEIEPVGVEQD